MEEYVCPMELGRASGSGSRKGFKPGLDIGMYDDDDLDRLEQVSECWQLGVRGRAGRFGGKPPLRFGP